MSTVKKLYLLTTLLYFDPADMRESVKVSVKLLWFHPQLVDYFCHRDKIPRCSTVTLRDGSLLPYTSLTTHTYTHMHTLYCNVAM